LNIEQKFSIYLDNVIFPTQYQKEREYWNISGILKKHSNQEFKFDVRLMMVMPNNQLGKNGTFASKADKIVFETDKEWIIIDVLELNEYVKKKEYKIIQLEDLLNKLDWNIILPKK